MNTPKSAVAKDLTAVEVLLLAGGSFLNLKDLKVFVSSLLTEIGVCQLKTAFFVMAKRFTL